VGRRVHHHPKGAVTTMAKPTDPPRVDLAALRGLLSPPPPESYLGPGEQCVLSTRLHWLVPLRAMARAGVMMVGVGVLAMLLGVLAPGVLLLQLALWAAATAHTAYLGWCVLLWRARHIMVTDSRIVQVSGIFNLSVNSVHLSKITDVTYTRTLAGRVLNYGTLRIESSGQQQAVELLAFVPSPGTIYRAALPSARA